ncbi:MAG TPA: hypothetical protein VFM45_12855 [Anaeromyxobacteraceae bacterium]|nr:hypothetical protein [Anaeromyxobacteraceae bacterium]
MTALFLSFGIGILALAAVRSAPAGRVAALVPVRAAGRRLPRA